MKENINFRLSGLLQVFVLAALLVTVNDSFAQIWQKQTDVSQGIFPKGQQGPASNFTGKAFNYALVDADSTYSSVVGNVYFEPGARSNWHTHPAGQILIITDGEGFHQIKGKPKEHLEKGDVVKCPPNELHWHGASPQTGMQQLYIIPNTEKGIVKWMQPVTDAEYNSEN
jgi:quercetin dioxygenase-like cupin family protein